MRAYLLNERFHATQRRSDVRNLESINESGNCVIHERLEAVENIVVEVLSICALGWQHACGIHTKAWLNVWNSLHASTSLHRHTYTHSYVHGPSGGIESLLRPGVAVALDFKRDHTWNNHALHDEKHNHAAQDIQKSVCMYVCTQKDMDRVRRGLDSNARNNYEANTQIRGCESPLKRCRGLLNSRTRISPPNPHGNISGRLATAKSRWSGQVG